MNNLLIKNNISALLGISIPLSILFTNYLFVLAIIVLLFSSPKRTEVRWLALIVLLIPALVPILSMFFHAETITLSSIEVKMPFIVVALVVAFVKINDALLSKFKLGFVIGTLVAAALALFQENNFVSFLSNNLFLEITYVSLFIVISLIYLWFTDIGINNISKLIISLGFVLMLFFIGESFFIIAGMLIVFAAIIVKGSSLQSKIAIGFLVLLFSLFLYKGAEIQQHYQATHTPEQRGIDKLAQWQCVLEIMKDRELFGVGYTSKKELLLNCYHEHSMFKAESMSLNAHNEYLDFFLIFGYIGVLGLLVYFFKLMFVAYDNKQVAQLLIIILIALFSITENVFTRQKGVMIAAITTLLIFSSKKIDEIVVEEEFSNK